MSDFDLSEVESGDEGDEEWTTEPAPVQVHPFVANTGSISVTTGFSALDFFKLVGFCESNFDRIAEETNRFARQAMETQADSAWRELDAKEIRAFFSVNVLFGIKQLPEVYS